MKTMAELVDDLFRLHRRPDGKEYTYMEVSVALDGAVEPSHLSKLRTGKILNPSRETLSALCRFFHVSPAYFFPELEAVAHEPPQEDPLLVALRSTALDADAQDKLEEFIRALQKQPTEPPSRSKKSPDTEDND